MSDQFFFVFLNSFEMKVYIIFTAFMLYCSPCFSQWLPQASTVEVQLHSIYFKNADNGVCAGGGDAYGYPVDGQDATILKTENGGDSWEKVFESSAFGITDIAKIADTIFAFGKKSTGSQYMIRSNDNGLNWETDSMSFFLSEASPAIKIFGNSLYVLSDLTHLFKLEGGVWMPIADGSVFDVNNEGIYIAGGPPHTLRSLATESIMWDTAIIPPTLFSESPYIGSTLEAFGTDTIIISVTYPNKLAYTHDKGITWMTHEYLNPVKILNIVSTNKIFGTRYENDKIISFSDDGGATFSDVDTLPFKINSFFFPNPNTGFLCGENGMIYKTMNGGDSTAVQELELKKKLNIYPNPVKGIINIEYEHELNVQRIQLNDASGRVVRCFEKNEKALRVSDLASGIYFLNIQTEEGDRCERIVLQ